MIDSLKAFFSEKYLFIDVNSIDEGENFPLAIKQSTEACEVVIAVIGPGWLASIKPELDSDPSDWVWTEIAIALKKKKTIVPVLVQGASMPPALQLPKDLKGLDKYNAAELSHTRWQYDVERLANTLHKKGIPLTKEEKRSERKIVASIVAVIVVVLTSFILVKEVLFKEPEKQAMLTPLIRKAPLVEGKWIVIDRPNSLLQYQI